jgi:biotin carboxyl carrier protein
MDDLIIKINEKEFKAKFKNSNPNIEINNNPYQVELIKKIAGNVFAFSVNNKMCQIEFELNEFGTSRLILDGIAFKIDITNETKKLLNQYIRESGVGTESGVTLIKAPMPGLVVKILIEEGQSIKKGDKIIIVEAMKMENSLQSLIDGTVKSVKVKEGQAVDKDTVMIEIEANSGKIN